MPETFQSFFRKKRISAAIIGISDDVPLSARSLFVIRQYRVFDNLSHDAGS